MFNVDFSRAKLRWVEFRGLNLQNVKLPNDDEHIIIENCAAVLDKIIAHLKQQGDQTARVLLAIFEVHRKWAPAEGRSLLNKHDLAEAGEDAVERILYLLQKFKAETKTAKETTTQKDDFGEQSKERSF